MTTDLLKYTSTVGLDVIVQSSLLIFGFAYASHCFGGEDWSVIATNFSILCSVQALGRGLVWLYNLVLYGGLGVSPPSGDGAQRYGTSTDYNTVQTQRVSLMALLGLSFVCLSLTTRFSLLAICFLLIGYTR
jgi:hypothetical protein